MIERRSGALVAAGLMITAMLCFVILDSALRDLASRGYGIGMLVTVRNAVQVVGMAVLLTLTGRKIRRPLAPWISLGRGVCVVLTTVFITLALLHLPMAQTYAVTFSAPLIAALLAVIVLGERTGWRLWLCILAGFGGVLIAVMPTGLLVSPALLFPLGMAAANAVFHVLTRLARGEDPLILTFWTGTAAFVICLGALPWTFDPLPSSAIALLVGAGLVGTLAHVLVAEAFRRAPTAIASPMIYSQIVWGVVVGFFVFGETPALPVIFGSLVVTVSGIALVRWANPVS